MKLKINLSHCFIFLFIDKFYHRLKYKNIHFNKNGPGGLSINQNRYWYPRYLGSRTIVISDISVESWWSSGYLEIGSWGIPEILVERYWYLWYLSGRWAAEARIWCGIAIFTIYRDKPRFFSFSAIFTNFRKHQRSINTFCNKPQYFELYNSLFYLEFSSCGSKQLRYNKLTNRYKVDQSL